MAIRLTKVKKAAIAIMEEALNSLSIRRKRITSMNKQSLISRSLITLPFVVYFLLICGHK